MRGRALGIGTRAGAALLTVGVLAWLPQYYGATDTALFAKAIYIAIAALGLNLLTGYNGQVSIGHGAFFGFGAYATAILMNDHGWDFLATLPVVAVASFVVGAAVGFPALRVKGLYLALITLGLAALFPDLVTKYVHGTGGTTLVQPPLPTSPGWAQGFAPNDDQWRYYLALTIGIVMFILAWNLVRGRFGRALLAVRDHDAAASTIGIDLARIKVGSFAISALYAGIAGSVGVMVTGLANAGRVETFQLSINFLVAVVIGGTATVLGPVVGAWTFVFLERATQDLFPDQALLSPAIFGVALILLLFALPDGIVGGARRTGRFARRKLQARRAPRAPDFPSPIREDRQ
ncbi:MAG: branched-chain amino acid ABC transporter permease [Acidimicrobiia bacterium]|nr:branched-chain amino acid ABC transporter permease [Acidimicrobiia bacterium]